jgi:hypothetical protein
MNGTVVVARSVWQAHLDTFTIERAIAWQRMQKRPVLMNGQPSGWTVRVSGSQYGRSGPGK